MTQVISSIPLAIKLVEVVKRTSLSRSSVRRRIKDGKFPKSFHLGHGRAVAWLSSDIDAWVVAQAASRYE